ncbi:glycoside hydrolase family 16 protein, partial [Backusella circina FSU 941]
CTNSYTDFSMSMDGWVEENGLTDAWRQTSQGIEMRILPPSDKSTKVDDSPQRLPYNVEPGRGPTFNATTYMQYGTFEATVKSAPVGGAVTAIIIIADGGDEIDFELLGVTDSDDNKRSNFFWGQKIEYAVNGEEHKVSNGPISQNFYTYKVVWTPETITWYINDTFVRRTYKSQTCTDDVCKYPTNPSRVQIGLWDGSSVSGTAQWAHGPINWNTLTEPVTAYIKDVTIQCDPKYNNVLN